MIFDKSDESFVLQATDAELRSRFTRTLRRRRAGGFVGGILFGLYALALWFAESHSGSAGIPAATAIVFFVVGMHADIQVKALRLFDRASSINPVQPTAARSAVSGG